MTFKKSGKARRTIARFAVPACNKCTDPIEVGQAIRMCGRSWAHCYCEDPWWEGKGQLAHRSKPHPQSKEGREVKLEDLR
jgi:hypothetical protein